MRRGSVGRRRTALAAVVAVVGAIGLAGPPVASAATGASVTPTTLATARVNTATTLTGLSVSGFTGSVLVTLATDSGTVALPAQTGLTAAYGTTLSPQASLSFTGSQSDINADLAAATLTAPSTGTANVTLTAAPNQTGLAFEPTTKHYFQYVASAGITWTAAEAAAKALTFNGESGYLATIPSKAVNDFISSQIQGAKNVWFGGSAADYPSGYQGTAYKHIWTWADGPRAGKPFAECTSLAYGTVCDGASPSNPQGFYESWANGEPNHYNHTNYPSTDGSSGIENYAVTNYGGSVGNWNDFPNYVIPAFGSVTGYVAEFGNQVVGDSTSTPTTATAAVKIVDVPGAPTGVTATAGAAAASVSWTAPASTGGSPVTGYTVTAYSGSSAAGTCTTTGATTCSVSGLTSGTTYTFTVTAANAVGTGPASAASNAVTPTASVTPTSTASVKANVATKLAGLSVNGFSTPVLVTVSTNLGTLAFGSTTGLTTAFGATALPGPAASLSFSGSQSDIDAALATLSLTSATTGSATVTITAAPFQTGLAYEPTTKHYFQYVPSSQITWTAARAAALASTFNGMTGYLATIPSKAVNDFISSQIQGTGSSVAHNVWFGGSSTDTGTGLLWQWADGPRGGQTFATCSSDTPGVVCDGRSPSNPQGYYESWAPNEPNHYLHTNYPSSDGSSGLENYAVTNYAQSVGQWNDFPNYVITGFGGINGYVVEYGDQLVGDSHANPTTASSVVQVVDVPGAPTAVTASAAGAATAAVSWTAPAGNGNSAVTGYTATAYANGTAVGSCSTTGATTCSIAGLTTGGPYTFQVAATNAAGTGPASVASSPLSLVVTPKTVTPTSTKTAPVGSSTTLTGLSVNGFTDQVLVTVSTNLGTLTFGSTKGLTAAYGATALPGPGATLSFSGSQSDIDAALATLALTSPSTGNATVTITAAPFQTGLAFEPTSGHYFQYVAASGITWTAARAAAKTQTFNGQSGYLATIPSQAVNDFLSGRIQGARNVWFGASASDRSSAPQRTWAWADGPRAGQPLAYCTSTNGSCDFVNSGSFYKGWASGEPNNSGGSEAYAVTNWGGGSGNWNDLPNNDGSAISGYVVEYGNSLVGDSSVSPTTASSIVAVVDKPAAPGSVTATPQGNGATVTWTAPATDGNSPVTGYSATVYAASDQTTPVSSCTATTTSCYVPGLATGTQYVVQVTATNAVGTGPAATAASFTVPVLTSAAVTSTSLTTATAGTFGLPGVGVTGFPDSAPILVTLSSTLGTLTLPSTAGLTAAYGSGFGPATSISFSGTQAAIQAALASLQLTATSAGSAAVTITAVPSAPGLAYEPTTGHYFQYIPSSAISWTAARAAAQKLSFNGLPGYLATIPSKAVNDFVSSKIQGARNVWFGAYAVDNTSAPKRTWQWADGPRAGQPLAYCTSNAPTTSCDFVNSSSFYQGWASGEPNNYGGIEGYAVTNWGGGSGNWNDLTNNYGASISGYVVEYGDRAVGVSSASTTATDTKTVVVTAPPAAPANVAATAGHNSATVTWSPPSDNGGSVVTGYTVTAYAADGSVAGTCTTTPMGGPAAVGALSCTVSGLADGSAYTFGVTAANALGTGPAARTTAATTPAPTAPGAPGVTATAGNGSATLTFTPPASDGGSPVTSYTGVVYNPDGTVAGTCVAVLPATSCTVTGLTNGTVYSTGSSAANALGGSVPSVATGSVTPALQVPSVPTNVATYVGRTTVSVSWTAPTDNGGSAVTGYTVTGPNGSTCTTGNVGPFSCQLTVPVDGATDSFTVVATNAVGTSKPATVTAVAPSPTVPDAPANVTATPVVGGATVSWSAPAFDGGTPVTGYTATAYDASGNAAGSCTTTQTSCSISGLADPATYTVSVVATNATGASAVSAGTPVTVPTDAPSAPQQVSAVPGNGSVTLSWSPPASSGAGPVTGYVVSGPNGTVTCTPVSETSCTVSGLANGTPVSFVVAAVNAAGTSVASAPATATPAATVPAAPTGLTVSPADSALAVSWTAPADTGGSPVTTYNVTVRNSAGGVAGSCTVSGTSCTVSGIPNGTPVTVSVTATNAVGTSPASATVSASPAPVATAPGAPTLTSVSPGESSVTAAWTAPASDGGSPVTGYVATAVDTDTGQQVSSCHASADDRSCYLGGLFMDEPVTVTVTAVNAAGTSAASNSGAATAIMDTTSTAPDAPTVTSAVAGNGSIAVTLTPPDDDGGSPIAQYTVSALDPQGGEAGSCHTATTSCTITGLANGTPYTVQAVASNAAVDGPPGQAAATVTPVPTVPAAPGNVAVTAGDLGGQVTWTAPADTGGAGPVTYTVTGLPGGATACAHTSDTWCDLGGLVDGTTYQLSVVATNAVGDSAPSAPVSLTPAPSAPAEPSHVTATASNGAATVSWQAQAAGGSPVTGYTATAVGSDGSTSSCSSSTTTCVLRGLTNGVTYTVGVTATNAVGSSVLSPTTTVTPTASAAPAPTQVATVPGDGQLAVSWTQPSSAASVTGYTATAYAPDGSVAGTCSATVTSCTIGSLTDGTAYTVTVVATGDPGGSSLPSLPATGTPAAAAVAAGPPATPTDVFADGDNALSVGWSPVAGATSYTATATAPDGSVVGTCTSTGDGCTIDGPVNGIVYSVTVTAANAVGASAPSAPYSAQPASEFATAPTVESATAGNGSVTVGWIPSAETGSGPSRVAFYQARAYDSTGAFKAACRGITVAVVSCTITGLTNGQPYTVRVQTVGGPTRISAPFGPVTPRADLPTAPAGLTVTPGETALTGSWTAPTSTGGSPVTGYTLTAYAADGSVAGSCTTTQTSCSIAGLTDGTPYTLSVSVANSTGSSAPTAPSPATSPGPVAPGAPTGVTATPDNGALDVSWTAPANDGGAPVTGYTATAYDPSGAAAGSCTTGDTACSITGLANGTDYTVGVVATNASGSSVAGAPAGNSVATPAPVAPDAPVDVTATPGNQSVTAAWTAPQHDGGAPVTTYTATASAADGTALGQCTTTGTSCQIGNLPNEAPVTVTVTATSDAGTSPTSDPSAPATPSPVAPGTPTGVTASATDGTLQVGWTPADPGGAPVTYTATATDPSGTVAGACSTSGTSCSITGLADGTAYTATVTAASTGGTSAASAASAPATPTADTTVPAAPTGVTATRGNGSLTASWTPPADATGVTGYVATAYDADGTAVSSCTTTDSTCSIGGLTAGTSYTVSVVALSGAGSSPASAPSAAAPAGPVAPSDPTAVTFTTVNQGLTVSWQPPVDDGGSPVTGYTVTVTDPVHQTWIEGTCTAGPSDTSCTVDGLDNGVGYLATVSASNAVGTSPGSTPAAGGAYTPGPTPPSAPTAVSVSADNTNPRALDVSWSAPAGNGGSALLGYTATVYAADGSLAGSCTAAPTATGCVVSGLAANATYTVAVVATNALGDSVAGSPAAPFDLPPAVPLAPTGVTVANGTVSWTPPTDTGGDPLTGYTATASNPEGTVAGACTSTGTSCSIDGLDPAVAYSYAVSAQNDVGTSAPVAPGAPTGVTVTPGNGTLAVGWTAPVVNGGSPVASYTATAYNPDGTVAGTCTGTGTTCTIAGLANGTDYAVSVVAANGAGSSAPAGPPSGTDTAPAPVAPGAPTGVTVSGGHDSATVSWTPPADTGGDPVTGYTAAAYALDGTKAGSCTTTETSCSIDGLADGTPYTFSVTATSDAGTSATAAPAGNATTTPAPTAPDAPTDVTVSGGSGTATVSWTAPANDGGHPITGYTVTAYAPDGTAAGTCTPTTGTSCTVTGLTDGVAYTFGVTATNDLGTSAAATPAGNAATTPVGVPSAPQNVSREGSLISWTAPVNDGGYPVTGYTVTAYKTNGAVAGTCTATTALSCKVPGLTGSAYTFGVLATNQLGTSAPVAPGAPTAVTVTGGGGTANVGWTLPVSSGGGAVTGYTATAYNADGTVAGTCTSTGAQSCSISGLTVGSAYTYAVTATGAGGTSVAATPAGNPAVTMPPGAPQPPTGITATGGNGTIAVGWTAPANDGGDPITSYTATAYNPDGTVAGSCTGSGTSCTIGGLTNGTTYNVAVTATNVDGTSSGAPKAGITPAPVAPGAPTGVTTTAQHDGLAVSWTAPADSGGDPVTGYTATAYAADGTVAGTCTTTTATTCSITGLTDGTPYTVAVTATTAAGTSAVGTPAGNSTTTPAKTVPAAPQGVTAATVGSDPTALQVSWTAPASDGGSPVTGYTATVYAADGSVAGSCTTTAATCTVTGLPKNASYTVGVTAANVLGSSTAAAPAAGPATLPPTVPSAPQHVSYAAGTLSWTAPADDGGEPITGYTATAYNPDGTVAGTCSTTTTSCVFTTLTGTGYTFAVTAANGVGSSAVTAPAAPAGVTVTGTNGAATVSWTAPADNGGDPVTDYTATAHNPDGTVAGTCTSSGTSCEIDGLANGTAYTFGVTAANHVGSSAAATPAGNATTTPAPVAPAAPTGITTSATNGAVAVSWTAPADNGGSAVTGYTVTAYGPDGKSAASCQTATTTCSVGGLTNGTAYTFGVTATNAAGTGLAGTAAGTTSPHAIAPGAPTVTSVATGNGTATASWTAPAQTGGDPVTGYTVTAFNADGTVAGTCTTTTTSCTVSGLANGTTYPLTVTATTDAGTSTAATTSATPHPVAPAAPGSVTATGTNGGILAGWTAPADSGGDPVTGYTATAYNADGTVASSCSTTSTACTITGLANGTPYSVGVTATTAAGTSTAAAAAGTATPHPIAPQPPTGVTATTANGTATVSWTAPADSGGEPVTGYTATAYNPDGTVAETCTTTATSCQIDGLANGTTYTFGVTATSAAGTSGSAAPASPGTPQPVAPASPTGVSVSAGHGTLGVSWLPSADDGGSAVTGYTATATRADGSVAGTCTTTGTSCTIGSLADGTVYTVTVTAANAAGTSTAASGGQASPAAAAPAAPQTVSVVTGHGTATVSWTAPASDGGSAVTGYTVTATAPDGTVAGSCTSTGTTCSISGLADGTTYTFAVAATNAAGTSAAATQTGTPHAVAPGAPTGVTTTGTDGALGVSWTAPAGDGGAAVTGYTATAYAPDGTVAGSCSTAGTTCSISGLTDGTAYTVAVTATNDAGTSAASTSASGSPVPVAPGAPSAVTVAPGNGTLKVSWDPPAGDGGAPVTGYTVTASAADGSVAGSCTTPATTCTVSGLANDTAYSVSVVAANAAGSSVPAAGGGTPRAVAPGAPTGVTATAGDGSVTVSWTAPADTGGDPVTLYTVTAYGPDGSVVGACTTTTTTSCTVANLSDGVAYTFAVAASSPAGTSPAGVPAGGAVTPSAPVVVTPPAPPTGGTTPPVPPAPPVVVPPTQPVAPTAPTALKVVVGAGAANVSFTAPTGSGVTYTVTAYAADGTVAGTCTTTGTACTVTGLRNNVAYRFGVTAKDAAGSTAGSAVTAAATPTAAATTVVVALHRGAKGAVTAAVTASGLRPGSSVAVRDGRGRILGSLVVGTDGKVRGTVRVPAGTKVTVKALGLDGRHRSTSHAALGGGSTGGGVSQPGGSLAYTGAQILGLLALGGLLLFAGAGLVAGTRRRRA